jgi:pimeloyl-ACP methyl ester carboxylesterase
MPAENRIWSRWEAGVSRVLVIVFLVGMESLGAGESVPEPGKQTMLRCREFPQYSYHVLLPDGYDAAKPCPILYTLNPGGGGMVAQHQSVGQVQPSIIVGITGSRNGRPERECGGEIYAVMLDTLDRFNVDPAAQYVGGFSGGAVVAYILARQYKERISGVIASGGWLQNMYDPWFIYPRGLLVARVCGVRDTGANGFAKKDLSRLVQAGCRVRDWSQEGGHAVGSPENIRDVMRWFVLEKPCDVTSGSARERSNRWAANPYSEAVIGEVLDVIKTSPHTRLGQLALIHLYAAMKEEGRFCKVAIPGSAAGPELSGFFGYAAYGAALANDGPRFRSAAYALGKVCPEKNSRWRGMIGALYLFASGDTVVDPVAGLAFVGGPAAAPDAPLFNQLVYAAALLKNGKATDAVKAAAPITVPPADPKLTPVVADLTKGIQQGPSALDAGIWLGYFGEGD